MPEMFGIHFSSISRNELFSFIANTINSRKPSYIVTPNLHFARLSISDSRFLSVLNEATLSLCDSAVLAAISKFKHATALQRLPGSDITAELMILAKSRQWRVFLFGSDDRTLGKVRTMYPDVVCGLICPPVHAAIWELEENESYLDQIKLTRADILLVGLGAQKQELWAHKYFMLSEVPVTLCIGASLDFIGGRIKRAPPWISRIGFEWLWRLCLEPRRLLFRYALDALFLFKHLPKEILTKDEIASSRR